jgi:hypothetical protein
MFHHAGVSMSAVEPDVTTPGRTGNALGPAAANAMLIRLASLRPRV